MAARPKRKRNTRAARYDVTDYSMEDTGPPTTSDVDNITISRGATGRLAQQAHTATIQISPEDLAILAEHPEYMMPSESVLDFEASVQEDRGGVDVTKVKVKKTRVCIASILIGFTTDE